MRHEKIWALLMRAGAKTGCHQRHERSFSVQGFQFPLCARCTGILAGQLAGLLAVFLLPFQVIGARVYAIPAAMSVFILGVDGLGQLRGFWESNNMRRFLTGLFCGFFTAVFYVKMLCGVVRRIKGGRGSINVDG